MLFVMALLSLGLDVYGRNARQRGMHAKIVGIPTFIFQCHYCSAGRSQDERMII